MTQPTRKRPSILILLSILIAALVTTVFIAHTANNFLVQRERITRDMEENAQRSLARLTSNIAPMMEAYAVNEYENLIATEILLEGFYAIRVEDKLLAAVLGESHSVNGSIQKSDGEYVPYNPLDQSQRQHLADMYYEVKAPVFSSSNEQIGEISIYMTGDAVDAELKRALVESFTASAILALSLTGMLIYAIRHLFFKPLTEISAAIAVQDEDGIPLNPAPRFRYREVETLSLTLNAMREVTRHARDAVQLERDRLQNVLDGTHVGTWEWHVQTGETVFNDRWAEIAGYTLKELEPISIDTWLKLVHPDDLEKSERALSRHFSGEFPYYECEARMKHKDGHWVWVLDRGKVFSWDTDGKPLTMYGTHQDISARRRAEEQLMLSASVFKHVREGIFITDAQGVIIDVNAAFSRITGYSKDEAIGQTPSILNSGRQSAEFYEAMWRGALHEGHWSGEIWNKRKSGEIYPELLTISTLCDSSGKIQNFVALFADISNIKEHERQLEQIAHYDVLTGLPNRFLLSDRLRQAIAQAHRHLQPLAILFLDLDGFKEINDSLGHGIGDLFLIELAKRLKEALREEDTLARLGGDEFVIILSELSTTESCQPVLERILTACSQQILIDGHLLQTSASIGVTFHLPPDDADADQLIRQADQAMYQAKLNGKNRYHIFDALQDRSLRHRYEEIEQIRKAMQLGEFELYYQPQVNLRSGKVVGVEALIRWNHRSKGVLAPGSFLPAIEEHELMCQLGEWTIEQALNQIAGWQRQGIHLTVSVNIAAVHLQHPAFVSQLQAALARHPEIPPSQLELEVLETSALDNMVQISKVMLECQAIGIMFSLDDFGTGYSTLSYLKHLPVRTLKIDQSFVRDMLDDADDLAILKGVLGLAQAFNLSVIAEGLESQAHGEKLLSLGCELAQGYGIARPMPANAIPEWVQSRAGQRAVQPH